MYVLLNLFKVSILDNILLFWFAMWLIMWYLFFLRPLVFLSRQTQFCISLCSFHTSFDTSCNSYFKIKFCSWIKYIVYYHYVKFRVIGCLISSARPFQNLKRQCVWKHMTNSRGKFWRIWLAGEDLGPLNIWQCISIQGMKWARGGQ